MQNLLRQIIRQDDFLNGPEKTTNSSIIKNNANLTKNKPTQHQPRPLEQFQKSKKNKIHWKNGSMVAVAMHT